MEEKKKPKKQKKKQAGRRAYLGDFKLNEKGDYVYTGITYVYCTEGKSLKRALAELWAFSAAVAVMQVIAGCIPAAGMSNTFYVILPYAFALVLSAYFIWVLIRITMGDGDLREYIYKATVERIPAVQILTAVLCFIVFAGDIVFIAQEGMGQQPVFTVLFLALQAASAALSLWGHARVRRLKWEKRRRMEKKTDTE